MWNISARSNTSHEHERSTNHSRCPFIDPLPYNEHRKNHGFHLMDLLTISAKCWIDLMCMNSFENSIFLQAIPRYSSQVTWSPTKN